MRVAAREGVPIVYHFQTCSTAYRREPAAPEDSLPGRRCAPAESAPWRTAAGTPWNRLWSTLRRNGTREKPGRNGGNGRDSSGAAPNPENMDRYAAEIEAAYAEVLAARRNGP